MWRHDPGRTASTPQKLPGILSPLWERQLPPLQPAFRDVRLQFDRGYEPIALGKLLVVASSHDDSVTAFQTDTGEQLWKFQAGGPVRCAPAGGQGRILFGCDDGHFYCLRASTGQLAWKMRAAPSARTLLGNGRLISVWPVRGGPVLREGRVYFAAGVWPLEGVFVYCLDAATGKVIWRNDRASYLYGKHPHQAEAIGGLAPQGYLLIDAEDLVVPSSSAYPARFDLATGELKEFQLPAAARYPGGWFAATLPAKEQRRGLVFDSSVNAKRHEDKPWAEGLPGIRDTLRTSGRIFRYADGFPGVRGTIHSMLAADGKLFAVTTDGCLHAFGEPSGEPRRYPAPAAPPSRSEPRAQALLESTGTRHGYAAVLGPASPDFLATLVSQSHLNVMAVDAGARPLDGCGFPAQRLAFPSGVDLPPYFASLIVTEVPLDANALRRGFQSLRPFGGILAGPPSLGKVARSSRLEGATIREEAGWTLITREGALPGSTNYTGGWRESPDALVRAPLGVLWFDDSVAHFKRSPQPLFVDGVMISSDKDWLDASTRTGKVDYRLLGPRFSDVYTGRVLSPEEAAATRAAFAALDRATVQPSQYRPPRQKDEWKPEAPRSGERTNPLTGEKEPRTFPKSYGCDGGFDYGHLYTLRSGTAAFYDKRVESGTVNISGPRSGCTNSVIPANGLLNVPYFYEGCTCSYPLPTALALTSMPESFEQWACWGHIPGEALAGKIQRLGLNFGAPGDRMDADGTLWIGFPNPGRPSPQIQVTLDPPAPASFYQHSLWLQGEPNPRPWVAASGLQGLRSLAAHGFRPGVYRVTFIFEAMKAPAAKPLTLAISGLAGEAVVDLSPQPDGTATWTSERLALDGKLEARFTPEASLCGIEVIPSGPRVARATHPPATPEDILAQAALPASTSSNTTGK